MWSLLHLYSLAIILYNQKVLQPKGPSVLNYDIWKQPTGHPSLTKSERLHANTQTYTHTHTCNTVSFSYRVIQMMALDYLDEALNQAQLVQLIFQPVMLLLPCAALLRVYLSLGLPWNSILFEMTFFIAMIHDSLQLILGDLCNFWSFYLLERTRWDLCFVHRIKSF